METIIKNKPNSTIDNNLLTNTNGNHADLEGSSAKSGLSGLDEGGKKILRKRLLCPSAPAKEGAILLGVVQPDGSVAFIKDRIEVTHEFLDIAAKDRTLENRFRFSSPCIGSACMQWANGGCGIPERLAALIPVPETTDVILPNCSIRAQCRWFHQKGPDACRRCPLVVTRSDE